MATQVDLNSAAILGREIRLTDVLWAGDPANRDPVSSLRGDTFREIARKVLVSLTNPAVISPDELAAIRMALALAAADAAVFTHRLTLNAYLVSTAGAKVGGDLPFVDVADFTVLLHLTDQGPRFGFQLPEGRSLLGVYDAGYDIQGDFTPGADRTYALSYDMGPGDFQFRVRTEASA